MSIPTISSQLKVPRNTLKGWFAQMNLTIPKEKRWENRDQAITKEAYTRSGEKRRGLRSPSAQKAIKDFSSPQERYNSIAKRNKGEYLGPQEWVPSNKKTEWSCQKGHNQPG
jgi:hypothetical protein